MDIFRLESCKALQCTLNAYWGYLQMLTFLLDQREYFSLCNSLVIGNERCGLMPLAC